MAGSILSGSNPLDHGVGLFLFQIVLIMGICQILGKILAKLKQPRVIAEIIGGIMLGPSCLGKIPGFTETFFPKSSLSSLELVANIGLIFFLFLVGLELDLGSLKENFTKSASISLAGIFFPFVCGTGASYVLYYTAGEVGAVPFTTFALFLSVAMSVTAFPVLARLLTERSMLSTPVGITSISAATIDDALAWCFLVLVMSLVNNTGDQWTALWVFLVTAAYALFCILVIRPLLGKLIRHNSNNDSITHHMFYVTISLILVSSFFTEAVGVHAIFGAFLIGLIIPHESNFAVQLTEKVEDMVTVLFLPLYFAYSGLQTRIDTIDSLAAFGLLALVIFTAMVGKVVGCGLAAKFSGHNWRESLQVGVLMSTKGLVELIVLNLGYQAGVINDTIFSIMIVMCIFCTMVPSVILSWLEKRPSGEKESQIAKKRRSHASLADVVDHVTQDGHGNLNILVTLHNMQTVPSIMTFLKMFGTQDILSVNLDALRLIELSDQRTSTLMKAAEKKDTIKYDPLMNVVKTFGKLNNIWVGSHLSVSAVDDFGQNIIEHASNSESNLILIPWVALHGEHEHEHASAFFDLGDHDRHKHHGLIDDVLANAPCSVAIYLDRGFSFSNFSVLDTMIHHKQRIFMPFIGGDDDCEALLLLSLFSCYPDVTAIVLRINTESHTGETLSDMSSSPQIEIEIPTNKDVKSIRYTDTMDNNSRTQSNLLSSNKEKDDRVWAVFQSRAATKGSRIHVEEVNMTNPIEEVIERCKLYTGDDLIVMGHKLYEHGVSAKSKKAMKSFVDEECKSSVLMVQKHASNALHM